MIKVETKQMAGRTARHRNLKQGRPPVVRLELIQLKQKGLYLEILDMSFFLQILVSTVATMSCIVLQNGRMSNVRCRFAFLPASWNAIIISCLASLALVLARAEFTFDLGEDCKNTLYSMSS